MKLTAKLKRIDKKALLSKLIRPKSLLVLLMFLTLGVSVAYSALSTSLNITGVVTEIRLKKDIRITDLSLSELNKEAESNYHEYNKKNINIGVYLPKNDSTVTYKVEVTNIGNVEMGILSIDNLPDNLDYELTDYDLKDKLCDSNQVCKLGIKKEFYITIKHKSGSYVATQSNYETFYTYNLNLELNFKPAYNVTYTDIEGTYPTTVLETDTLEVDLGESAPNNIKVLMKDVETTNYTYENGILTIPNVNGDIEIIKSVEEVATLGQYIIDLYTPNSTVVNNAITYNVDTTNAIIDDGLGGTIASGGNLRYYGANPNNYIDIGDRDADGNVILWRIIGLFDTKYATDEMPCNVDNNADGHFDNCASDKLVKIIRDESIGQIAWYISGVNANDWSTATLKTYLNTSTYYRSLSTEVTQKIENVLWNLGGLSTASLYSEEYYKCERGTTVYNGNPIEWVGNIGLMYPSDYGYATDFGICNQTLYHYDDSTSSYACRTNDWLYDSTMNQWTISSSPSGVFSVSWTGFVHYFGANLTSHLARPVLYLKSNVTITGTGTTTDGISYYIVE